MDICLEQHIKNIVTFTSTNIGSNTAEVAFAFNLNRKSKVDRDHKHNHGFYLVNVRSVEQEIVYGDNFQKQGKQFFLSIFSKRNKTR